MIYPSKWYTYHLVQHYYPINKELENINEENFMIALKEDRTGSYISRRIKERLEIKKALRNDILQHDFKYFNNFIIIGNKTYNGWNRDMIDSIVEELVKECKKQPEREINISDFEFEEV